MSGAALEQTPSLGKAEREIRSILDEDGERQMIALSPAFQSTARRLIEEAAREAEEIDLPRAAERVFQELHDHLAKLIGVVGFRTLLARSLKLAREEAPALEALVVKPDGELAGLAEALVQRSPAETLAAPTTLLAHFLALLAAFVGDELALHLVSEAVRRNEASEGAQAREDRESPRDPGSEDR